jgi:hypothetical protein
MRLLNKSTGRFINVPSARLAVALIRSDEYMFINDDFKESEHPRDEDGKFTSSGGSSGHHDIEPYGKNTAKEETVTITKPNGKEIVQTRASVINSLKPSKQLKNGGYIDHNGFEHSPNLNESQRAVENGFYTEILKNTPKLIADYKAKFKNKIDPDDVKRLDPNFDKDSSLAAAVHEPSSYLSKVIWNQALKEKKERGDTSPVLFTAGGSGSGKSEAGELAKAIIGAEEDPLTFDSVLGNFDKSTKKIDEALQAQDGKIDIVYTNAPLELAVLLNMKRSRTVKLDTQIEAHFAASENIRKLAEHYKNNDRVKITVVNNTGDPPDLAEGSLADVPTYSDRESIRKRLVAHAEHLVKNNLIKDKEGNLIPDPEKRLKLLLG